MATMLGACDDKGPVHTEQQETVRNEMPGTSKEVAAEAEARGQALGGYEDLTVWETVKTFKMNSLICMLVAFSSATDGYQIMLIGSLIANKGFVEQFGTQSDGDGNPVMASNVISSWSLVGSIGQIVGMIGVTFFTNQFGRKGSMYLYWLLIALGTVVECVSRDYQTWYISKILGGMGVGAMQATIPGYIAEVAPVRSRGTFLTAYSLWFLVGQFFAPIALQVMNQRNPLDWLTPVYTQWSQVGLMILIYVFVPESPIWCVNRGKTEQAKKSLRFINKGVPNFDVDHAYELISLNLEHEKKIAVEQRSEAWWSIFKGTDGKRTLICCILAMSGGFIGVGLFLSTGTYFFQQIGMQDPFMITCITSGINIAASIIIIFIADHVGRRPLAFYGVTICVLANAAVGILGVVPKAKATDVLTVLFACCWNIGLVCLGAAAWSLNGEISSARLRHYTSGFSAASGSITGLGLGYLIPFMLNAEEWNWGLKTCWFYVGTGLPFVIAVWFFVPEVKNRSAAELDELFERKIKPYKFHKTQTATQRMLATEEAQA